MKIEVVAYRTGTVVRVVECGASKSRAEKADMGIQINLDHDKYFTRIIEN